MADNRATLINKETGDRQAIEMGSDGEKDLFSKGYTLETEAPTQEDKPATFKTDEGTRTTTDISGKTQNQLYEEGFTPEVNLYNSVLGDDYDPTDKAVSSSSDAEDVINNASKTVADDLTETQKKLSTPVYQQYADYTSEIDAARTSGKTLYDNLMANIEADFAIRKEEQIISNRIQTGSASKQLARMGSFGRAGSAIDYMKSVQVRNERELNKLLVQKNQLLLDATAAFQANDWTMLSKKISESKAITDKYNEIQTWQFEDSLKNEEEARRQQQFGWEKEDRAMEKISTIASSGINFDDLSIDEISKLENDAGLPSGTFKAVYDAAVEANKLESAKDDAEFQLKIYDVLKNVPKDRVVEIGGNYYTGTKDSKLTLVTDGKTNKQYVMRELSDGTIEKIDLGIKGKGQPSSYTSSQLLSIGSTIISATKEGEWGGQCGEYVHQIVGNYPYNLDTLEEKMSQIDPSIGTGPDQNLPQVGDVVIQASPGSPAEKYGHVSVINQYDPETGIMILSESNYIGEEIVSHSRTLNTNDATVMGFFRGTLRQDIVKGKTDGSKDETVEFDDFLSDTMDELENGDLTREEAHDKIYTKYKAELDASAKEYGYDDGRLFLDEIMLNS